MNTEFGPANRESPIGLILLFPFRAVERARGWRRIGLLAAYGVIALMICAMLMRQSQLARLPDVGDSVGTASDQVSDDRNAFVSYREATQRFREMTEAEGNSFNKTNLQWSRADASFRRWLADNDPAIALMCEGTMRPEAFLESTGPARDPMVVAEKSEVIRRLSWIGDAAIFKAERLQSEGDPAGAWSLFKAVIRVSRDMERALPTSWSRVTAIILVQYARQPVADWAGDNAVSPALLRRALDDLAALEGLTPPISHFCREEYGAAEESFQQLSPEAVFQDQQKSGIGRTGRFGYLPALEVYLRGEPERSFRVLRLLAANDLAWCDRPVSERPDFAVPRLRIYEHDATTPAAARALAPDVLARWCDSTLIVPALKWRLGELDEREKQDRWSLNQLTEAVAVSLFNRETGRPPATPAEAIRRYRPVAGDTPGRNEAEPLP
jgi:hypothetical protein